MIEDDTQAEIGIGTVTSGSPNTLSRDTVLWTTQKLNSAPQRLNFSGSVRVRSAAPAEYLPLLSPEGNLTVPGTVNAAGMAVSGNASVSGDLTGMSTIELGSTSVQRATFIDFHTDGNASSDNNARIFVSPVSSGLADMTLYAASVSFSCSVKVQAGSNFYANTIFPVSGTQISLSADTVSTSKDIKCTGNLAATGGVNSDKWVYAKEWISADGGMESKGNVIIRDTLTFDNANYFRFYKGSANTPSVWFNGTLNYIPWSPNVTQFKMVWPSSGSPYLEIQSGGTYGVTVFSSTKEWKKDISAPDIADPLSVVRKMPVSAFTWRQNEARIPIGFIADDLAEIAPDAVFEIGDQKLKNINLLSLSAYVIAAIQSLATAVDEYEKRIASLEDRIAKLETR
ncbi:tail fiber domain-containing protein [Granulibacter bethesdensis]|uniref:tail fiber domain-containing protein n=1 Tax=Granulibacter bethesdensis TaxID=364410 RepID=UPI001C2014C5|nr:tail fiber domain-containing protein [Granulibacter bethesdensis]